MMFSPSTATLRRPFRFRGCLIAKKTRRGFHKASIPPISNEDKLLFEFFNQSHGQVTNSSSTGLFRHRQMTSPELFPHVAYATMIRADYIVKRIVNAKDDKETRKIVKNIDRLSDLLCKIIDLLELVRHVHPSKAWVDAANNTYDVVCEYMNGLNTDVKLAAALDRLIASPSFKALPADERQTALIFQHDFQKSGVHLPDDQRRKFVTLSSSIISLGRDFLQGANASKPPVTLTRQDCEGVPENSKRWQLYALNRGLRSTIRVDPNSAEARRVLKFSTNAEGRKKVYIAQNTSTSQEIEVVEALLRERAQLASLVGFRSYADMLLKDKMGENPENVRAFLDSLLEFSKPRALKALQDVQVLKQKREHLDYLPQIQAWDRDAYFPSISTPPPVKIPHISPGSSIFAFSRLLKSIYGISLQPSDVINGETWHKDVRKLDVVDENEGVVGWIYLDLFYRPGKASGSTHYTLQCSRRVDDDDADSDYLIIGGEGDQTHVDRDKESERDWVLATEKHTSSSRRGAHQRPIAVISCDLDPARERNMEWQDVVTLWHELGHAMHSMIGRTNFGNVAGTRCATDFVELPSILMEHFLTNQAVLSLFFVEGPPGLSLEPTISHSASRAIEAHSHILLASLDQHYHSEIALSPKFDSTRELATIQNTQGVLPYVEGTSWQTSFGHLFSYGASYYSYLFDRAIASRVWAKVFRDAPLSRENGERFKEEVLKHGGGKDPWHMVSELLREPVLMQGGAEAMREVGRWGMVDEVASGGPLA